MLPFVTQELDHGRRGDAHLHRRSLAVTGSGQRTRL